jgi:uncharacterized protein (DUF1501 family)
LTRRDVLRGTWQALAGATVAPLATVPLQLTDRRTVIVRLRGGADGLSLLPPYGDWRYRLARPTIALPSPGTEPRAAIDLDGFFGVHPALAPILPLFDARQIDVWPACCVPGATPSHLRADEALDAVLTEFRAENPRVLVTELREWDHHAGYNGCGAAVLERSVDDLARGLAALVRQLGDRLAATTIVTVSEFGRAIDENTHGGTEHGDATAMLVIGGGVRRGRIRGSWPGLGSDGGLRATASVPDVLRSLSHA